MTTMDVFFYLCASDSPPAAQSFQRNPGMIVTDDFPEKSESRIFAMPIGAGVGTADDGQ